MAKRDDFDSLKLPPEDFKPLEPPRKRPEPPKPAAKPVPAASPVEAARPGIATPTKPLPSGKPASPKPPPPPPSIGAQSKIIAKTLVEICKDLPLGVEARKLLQPDMTVPRYLDELRTKELFEDATRFLAYALPKREAVWWAAQCSRHAHGDKPEGTIEAALQAAEQWARAPLEENRYAALPLAKAAQPHTPAGSTAYAAFWSGASLGPAGTPAIPPSELLCAKGVTGAVLAAVLAARPEAHVERFNLYLNLGVDIANGKNRWKRDVPAEPGRVSAR